MADNDVACLVTSGWLSVDEVTGLVKDRAAAKDLAAFAKQLQGLDATPQEVGSASCFLWVLLLLACVPKWHAMSDGGQIGIDT